MAVVPYYDASERALTRLGRSSAFGYKTFQYACASCGILTLLAYFLGIIASDFLPPIAPTRSAESTRQHYVDHETGVRFGAILIMASGFFYLPYTAIISAQMNRMPHIPYLVSALQLGAGASGVFALVLPGCILALIPYRLERNVEITQMLNDFFWFVALMPWPTYMAQNWALSYAILTDRSAKPLFPKYIAIVNILTPIFYLPASFLHFAKRGPIAWNGALSWWVVAAVFFIEVFLDSICLIRAIRHDTEDFDTIVNLKNHTPDSGEDPVPKENGV